MLLAEEEVAVTVPERSGKLRLLRGGRQRFALGEAPPRGGRPGKGPGVSGERVLAGGPGLPGREVSV